MAYIFYNPNPAGSFVGDCVIRAITKATDSDWDSVYLAICMKGFELKDMGSSNAVWGAYLRSKGYFRKAIPNTCPDCYSIREFTKDHPNGSFILATGSHVVAVNNGNYYDAWDSGNEIPIYYWAKEDK